jgi:ribosome maturation factor RimP
MNCTNFAVKIQFLMEGTKVPSFIGLILSNLSDDIAKIVKDNLPDNTYFLVDATIKGGRGNEKIVILIDGDHGVDIETCSSISRVVSKELDRSDIMKGRYTLEVSSPGVDYPLKTARQYKKNLGKQLMIMLHDKKNIRGELIQIDDQGIEIKKEEGGKKKPPPGTYIFFNEIKKAKVLVTFK